MAVPTDIAGLKLWLKADAIAGLSDGVALPGWSDASGLGNTASQGTASKRPVYKTNRLNGKPSVLFDGVDDVLTTPSVAFSGDAVTIFMVARVNVKTSFGHFLSYGTNAAGSWNFRQVGTTGRFSLINGVGGLGAGVDGSGNAAGATTNLEGAGFVLLEGQVTAGDVWTIWQSGLQQDQKTVAFTLAASNAISIGSRSDGFPASVDVCEVIVYSAALSAADRQSVEDYLNAKWFSSAAAGSGFHNEVYPLSLDRCLSTWEWITNVIELGGGEEQRIPVGQDGRRKFNASHGVRSLVDLQKLLVFHALRHGETYGFKVRDLVDYTVTKGPEGTLQYVYNGTQKSFQLQKIYSDTSAAWFREIYKPEQGSVKVWKNSVLLAEGVDYVVNYLTGVLTLAVAPAAGNIIEWEGRFYVPVRFAISEIPAAEFIACMEEDPVSNQWVVKGGAADLPDVLMIEIKDI